MATAPFYGDPAAKAKVWNKWAVLLGGLSATVPTAPAAFTLNDTTGPVTGQWDPVGALDEDNPFGDGEESIDVTEHTAAGFGTYAKTYKNQQETIEFTALETTLVTLGILYDASGLTEAAGVISGKLKQRDASEKFKIAFQRENSEELERRISENYAQINSVTRNTGDGRSTYTVSVTIYPTDTKELYDYYLGPVA
jgi:hypothetical protein